MAAATALPKAVVPSGRSAPPTATAPVDSNPSTDRLR